jgi:hypothetical protein
MDENTLAKLISDVVKEELNTFKQEVATKEDLKIFATKEDIEKLRSEMATKEDLKAFAAKEDIERLRSEMATKEDLKAFATKEDLKAFATKEDLRAFATKEDFGNFLLRFDARMKQFQEGVQLMLREFGNDIQEIKLKLSMEYGSYSSAMSLIDQAVGIMQRSEHEQMLHRQQTVRELVELEKRIQRIEEFKQKVLEKIVNLQ